NNSRNHSGTVGVTLARSGILPSFQRCPKLRPGASWACQAPARRFDSRRIGALTLLGSLFPIPPISHHHSRALPERDLCLRSSQTAALYVATAVSKSSTPATCSVAPRLCEGQRQPP